jgi:hypothetical protein
VDRESVMKNKWFTMTMGLLLMVGLASVALGVVNLHGLRSAKASTVTLAQAAQNQPTQSSAAQIVGNYSGAVKLNVTVGGVYSDTLTIPPAPGAGTPVPPDLGSIDLSLQLAQTGNGLSGYVSLDKTLVYSVEHTIGAGAASVKIGPYVSGAFDGSKLTLQSEKVTLVVSGRKVQRQFRLTGTSTASDGGQVSGEYRETLWGYTSVPVTVIGTFTLQRPGFGSNVPVPSNKAPTVVADSATAAPGAAVSINVLANDSDTSGDVLTITSVSKPQHGVATTDSHTVSYTPSNTFSGVDTFSYVVSDGKGGSAVGSVTVTVGAGNTPTSTSVASTPVPTPTSGVATPTPIAPTATPSSPTPIPTVQTPIAGSNIFLPLINR